MLKVDPNLRTRPVNIHIPDRGRRLEVPRKYTKLAGNSLQGLGALSSVVSAINDVNRYNRGEISGTHLTFNLIMNGVGFLGPWCAGVSIIYGFAAGYIRE